MSKALQPQLIDIQKLQFSDKIAAEKAMLAFLQEQEDPAIAKVELLPKPESLNSISGFVTYSNNERFFFKSHVEENEQVGEYYNAKTLADAGYPMVVAKQITQRVGKQIALYEIVSYPTLFDLVKVVEDKNLTGSPATDGDSLIAAQNKLDAQVMSIYENTLKVASQTEHEKAPINQLFLNRLKPEGRLDLFYRGKQLVLDNQVVSFSELADKRWTINGVRYASTLNDLIEQSIKNLAPTQGPSIVGHGDAHNGNVFVDVDANKFMLFDPAFAGRHDPLLDLTKPLFHNVFARWMYFPEQVNKEVSVSFQITDDEILVKHNFAPSALRVAFLRSKIKFVLEPLLALLSKEKALRADWQPFLRAALFCCPFLTVNLLAKHVPNGTLSERYPPAIKLLGLCMAVELGAPSRNGENQITDLIDQILSAGNK